MAKHNNMPVPLKSDKTLSPANGKGKHELTEKSVVIIVVNRLYPVFGGKANQRLKPINKGRARQDLNLQPSDPKSDALSS